MKYEILVDGSKKAEIPGNLNKDKFADLVKMYLFNIEYEGWKKLSVIRVEPKENKKNKKVKK